MSSPDCNFEVELGREEGHLHREQNDKLLIAE